MSHSDSNIESWQQNMNVVFGKYGWCLIENYRIGEKMNDIPKENIEEPKNEIVIEPTIDEVVEPSTDIVKDSEQPTALTQNIFGTTNPADFVKKSQEYAKALVDVVENQKLYADIQGKKYVTFEGWQFLGSMLPTAITPQTEYTVELRDEDTGEVLGYKARVLALDVNGNQRGASESVCMYSERNWNGKDANHLMSMAQTRASSKALRMALSSIVKLAGYEPTPKEEMDGIDASNSFKNTTAPQTSQPTSQSSGSSSKFDQMATEAQINYLKVLVNKNLEHEICKDVPLLASINKGEISKSKASELIETLKGT